MPDNAVQENWLTRIGGLRDGFLVMASVIYGTGYLVWSLQAWRLGLGLLPALDAQYFAAGFIPVLVVIAAIYVFNLANELLKRLLTWLHSEPRTSGKSAVGTAAYVLSIAPIAFLLVANSSGFLEQIIPWEWAIPIVIVALLLGSLLSPSKIGGIEFQAESPLSGLPARKCDIWRRRHCRGVFYRFGLSVYSPGIGWPSCPMRLYRSAQGSAVDIHALGSDRRCRTLVDANHQNKAPRDILCFV